MATYSTPTLGTVTLPDISQYSVTTAYREVLTVVADGALYVDSISGGTAKHDYTMRFDQITSASRTTTELALAEVATASASFVNPEGGTVTVTRHPDQPGIVWEATDSVGTLYWSGTMKLREV